MLAASAVVFAAPTREQLADVLQQAQASFDQGTQLARQNPAAAADAFRRAAAGYQSIIDAGVHNGYLYYNLGNAHLQLNDVGRAIVNYRRAERFIPGDARLRANLTYARSLRKNQIEQPALGALSRSLLFWHHQTPLRWRFAGLLAVYALFWAVLIVRTFVRRGGFRFVLVPLALLGLALAASVSASWAAARGEQAGVVVADEVIVRKGNGEGYEPRFEQPLWPGVEFDIVEERADWLHIKLPDAREGWIRSADAERV